MVAKISNMKDILKNLLPLFTEQLAKLFDKLRLASPLAYLIVTALIVGGGEFLRGSDTVLVNAPEWLDYVIIVIEVLTPVLLSSRTKRHIVAEQEKISTLQMKVLSVEEANALLDQDD